MSSLLERVSHIFIYFSFLIFKIILENKCLIKAEDDWMAEPEHNWDESERC